MDLRLVDGASHHRATEQPSKNRFTLRFLKSVRFVSAAHPPLRFFQKGPPSGNDKVKKGGSYMCHKVKKTSTLNKLYWPEGNLFYSGCNFKIKCSWCGHLMMFMESTWELIPTHDGWCSLSAALAFKPPTGHFHFVGHQHRLLWECN